MDELAMTPWPLLIALQDAKSSEMSWGQFQEMIAKRSAEVKEKG